MHCLLRRPNLFEPVKGLSPQPTASAIYLFRSLIEHYWDRSDCIPQLAWLVQTLWLSLALQLSYLLCFPRLRLSERPCPSGVQRARGRHLVCARSEPVLSPEVL